MGKHNDFIKISYCIFKIHKLSAKFFMKSSYEKDLKSVNTKEQFAHQHFNFNEPASSQEVLNGELT